MRLVISFGLLAVLIQIAQRIAGILKINIDWMSLWIGIIIAVILGFLNFLLTDWWGIVTRQSRPQTITLKTTETPRQITWASTKAIVGGVGLFIITVLLIAKFLAPQ